ncbi:hypothetical protein QNM34_18085 [Rahnella bonaserana]|uniref:hypothetical protein n=1 Tax=Rahnella bonaserana TaxID=2816248 RepID=UPI0024C2FCEF|nr:hypothetical protein [Rahnella bonaserana]WHZ39913.1 hypothetical protein QNM34_18085 [Rahnella bonaserana]
MKKLALVLFLAGLANSAWAADSIDVQFKGTLTNPTCTATLPDQLAQICISRR